MNIFVTGANGFLGGSLVRHLRQNHQVHGSVRSLEGHGANPCIVKMDLRNLSEKNLFAGQDVVIHCAHDFSHQSYEINLKGTKQLFYMAEEAGVTKQIFISSFSALPDAISIYGKTKYALERFFLEQNQTVIRLGLVIGNGGIFAKIARSVLKSPIVPLIDKGQDRVPILAITDFNLAMAEILQSNKREYNLFNPEFVSMAKVYARAFKNFVGIDLYLLIFLLQWQSLFSMP